MAEIVQRQRSLFICAGLTAMIVAVYWPVHYFDFINFDDPIYVVNNRHVQGGLKMSGLVWALTSCASGYWHPLTWLSHMADCQLYALAAGGHHVTNVLLHVINTLLLFVILQWMTGAAWRSALVAALFGLHPLHVESVAWVAERKDVLSTCMGMLTLLAYAWYVERPQSVRYLLALGLYVLSLMCKPMLVTLPFVLLLLDWWPLGRLARSSLLGLLWEKIPFLVLATGCCVVTYEAQRGWAAVVGLGMLPVGVRLCNAMVGYARYLGMVLWPEGLAVFYPYRLWSVWVVSNAVAALVGVSAVVLWRGQRKPWLGVGWLWYLGTLVPVIGLVQVGSQALADRYMYIPLIGLLIMTVWSVPDVRRGLGKSLLIVTATSCVAACGLLSALQVRCWNNSETLFRHAIAATIGNYLAYDNLGFALAQQGKLGEAVEYYEAALQINPKDAELHNNLGKTMFQLGKVPEAIRHLEQALRLKPDFADGYYNLGTALIRLDKVPEGVWHLQQALRLKPDFADGHYNLGTALLRDNKMVEGIAHLEQALRLQPAFANAHYNLGTALLRQGEPAKAVVHLEGALRLNPQNADARDNLGIAWFRLGQRLAAQGKWNEAIKNYRRALEMKPDHAQAHDSLGLALGRLGQSGEALMHYRKALEIAPRMVTAQNDLAWMLATCADESLRNGKQAVGLAEEANRLASGNNPAVMDTLAAAYAEVRRFDDAVRTAQAAIDLMSRAGRTQHARQIETRLQLYQAGRPYHEAPIAGP